MPDDPTAAAPAATAVRRREIWTRLAVDPIAGPLGRALARVPGVTPNRVTGLSALAGLGAAACFAAGLLRIGALLFYVRFLLDVVDGVVAREQSASSARGAALDVAADVAGIGLCFAGLAWHLERVGHLPLAVALLLLAAVVFYNWVLAYRKGLGAALGVGDGGAMGDLHTGVPVLRSWFAVCARLNMSPVPWAVEAETAALFLAPLLLPTRYVWFGLLVALTFYILADLVNLRRVLALADAVQTRRQDAAT